jgi:hypothetical protein
MRLGSYRPSGTTDLASIIEYHARVVRAAKKARLAFDDGRARNTRTCRPLDSPWISSDSDSEVSFKRQPSPPPPLPPPPLSTKISGGPPPPVNLPPPKETAIVFTAPGHAWSSADRTTLLPTQSTSPSPADLRYPSPPPIIVEVEGDNNKSINNVRTLEPSPFYLTLMTVQAPTAVLL